MAPPAHDRFRPLHRHPAVNGEHRGASRRNRRWSRQMRTCPERRPRPRRIRRPSWCRCARSAGVDSLDVCLDVHNDSCPVTYCMPLCVVLRSLRILVSFALSLVSIHTLRSRCLLSIAPFEKREALLTYRPPRSFVNAVEPVLALPSLRC